MALKELTTVLTERLRSPVFGSYAIAWITINWEIVAHAVSDHDLKTKLATISVTQRRMLLKMSGH